MDIKTLAQRLEGIERLDRQIRALTDAVTTLTATIQAANDPAPAEDGPFACEHPAEYVTDVSAMGTGPKWLCRLCEYSHGFTNDERRAMGLPLQA